MLRRKLINLLKVIADSCCLNNDYVVEGYSIKVEHTKSNKTEFIVFHQSNSDMATAAIRGLDK